MTLRLIKRNWISTLQASDFAQGAAKYVTQTQDDVLIERKVTSAKEAQKVELATRDAGVYVVQLEAYDRLKRRQQVSVDFFVGGDTPVTFARPPASIRDDHDRQGQICAGRDRDAHHPVAVPERARARHRRTAEWRLRL